MSLRINTNVIAMNVLRNVLNTSDNLARSVERLSSGLRINRASDDPAGLIVSESLRAQIVGLQQAVTNSQDASNLVKTAEGALEEIHTLLRSMRQLAVHANNTGVNDQAALQADQNQIRSALDSINRIAQQTQFGSKRLLDGTAGISSAVIDPTRLGGAFFTSTFNGVSLASGVVSINVTQVAAQASIAGTTTYASATSTVSAGTIVINGQTIVTNGTETVQTLIDKINALSSVTGVTANLSGSSGVFSINLRHREYGANFSITLNDSNNLIGNAGTVSGQNAVAQVEVQTANGATTALFTGGRTTGDSGLRLSDTYGNVLLLSEAGNVVSGSTFAGARITAGDLQFQIGANFGQWVRLSLNDVRTSQLGTGVVANKSLADIDVSATGGAEEAIKIIDAAIAQISKLRGDIGSFQRNILESNIRSLSVARENLSATESTIRDVNVADEMTNFTKLQILQQAGMAVLAQANLAPQAVLQLLR